MNSDSEVLRDGLMAWLFQEGSPPLTDGPSADRGRNQRLRQTWGELPAVQDRFQAILKRRLYAEIERNPPLFPWETELSDYTTPECNAESVPKYADQPEVAPVGVLGFWSAQLDLLELPVPLPSDLLSTLLSKAQALLHSSLREGARLVRCVEDLFPDQGGQLNQIAGLVLSSPTRSLSATLAEEAANGEFPGSYEQAQPQQQMALSLLAARQILSSLTVSVRPGGPTVKRLWQTPTGALQLSVSSSEAGSLQVNAQLPCAGALSLLEQAEEVDSAQRSRPGLLTVAAAGLGRWTLRVELQGQEPLTFALQLED